MIWTWDMRVTQYQWDLTISFRLKGLLTTTKPTWDSLRVGGGTEVFDGTSKVSANNRILVVLQLGVIVDMLGEIHDRDSPIMHVVTLFLICLDKRQAYFVSYVHVWTL